MTPMQRAARAIAEFTDALIEAEVSNIDQIVVAVAPVIVSEQLAIY